MLVHKGRYPALVASFIIEIAGTPVATVMFDKSNSSQTPTVLASFAIHEAFHVYQQLHHPDWPANEVTLYLYPLDDANLLSLRRIETEALRRALAATDSQKKLSWTLRAPAARGDRYAAMVPEFSTYERRTELNEGLATYVEANSVGRTDVDLPQEGYRADQVRGRCYKIGHALAVLLDTFAPTWKTEFEADDKQVLDLYLAEALKDRSGQDQYDFTESEIANFEGIAKEDVRNLIIERSERKKAFDSRAGMRLTVIAPDSVPLRVSGVDPSNIMIVEGGLLHTRFLKLRHENGQLEMLTDRTNDIEALTVAAGPHPLISGVLRLEVAGLDKLDVEEHRGGVNVSGSGLTAHFDNASVAGKGAQITVHLSGQS